MEIIDVESKEKWNQLIKSFAQWDIYYLNEYAVSLQLHGDGRPYLIYHEKDGVKLAYVVMQKDIAKSKHFTGLLKEGELYDWETPYGYGGPLIEGAYTQAWVEEFVQILTEWCQHRGIVTEFFRFHPLLQNQKILENVNTVLYMKKTVYIDTVDKEIIFRNMTPNNRNMVRKAMKNGVQIIRDNGERIEDFCRIYQATMKNNKAEEYYYFEKEYFDYLIHEMKENMVFFYAIYNEKPISSAIFFYNQNYMHYHLSGTLPEYRKLAATNLLLSEAANWAAEQGIEKLHLGGGVGIEDSLLTFKKHFNRNGLLDFCIGRTIFNQQIFDELVSLRQKHDKDFDIEVPFLIKYRG